MGLQTVLETGIYQKLTTSAGTAVWRSRVYSLLAPMNASRPYVVFAHMAGGDSNQSFSRIVDMDFRVECVAESNSTALSGADYIESALHDGSISVSGWNCIAVTAGALMALVELVEGKTFYRRGAIYRVRLSK